MTVLALTLMSDLSTRTGVTLVALPALFIVVPGDTLSAAAGELLGGRLTTGTIRLIFAFFTLGLIVIGIVAATGLAGHGEVLVETLPPAELPLAIVLVGWMVFSVGLVLAFNARGSGAPLAGPERRRHVPAPAGSDQARRHGHRHARGGHGARCLRGWCRHQGATSLLGGDVVTGVQHLADFALQVPTVAISVAAGILLTEHWQRDRVT